MMDALLLNRVDMARIRIALRYYGVVSNEENKEEYLELSKMMPQEECYLIPKGETE